MSINKTLCFYLGAPWRAPKSIKVIKKNENNNNTISFAFCEGPFFLILWNCVNNYEIPSISGINH